MECADPQKVLEGRDLTRPPCEDPSTANNLAIYNAHKASDCSKESLRLLVKRKDRDLDELREFVNLERESFIFRMEEQQNEINCHLMRRRDAVTEGAQKFAQHQPADDGSASAKTEKVPQNSANPNRDFTQLKLQLSQSQADLKLLKDISDLGAVPVPRYSWSTSTTIGCKMRLTREVCIMDSII